MTPYLGYETYSVFYFSFYYPRDTFGTHLAYLSGVKFKLHTGWKSGVVSFSKSIMCLSGTVSLLVNSSPLMLSSGTYKMSNSSQRTFKAMLILQQDCLC